MRKVTLLCGMLLALVATVASAGPGVNLRWNPGCFLDGAPIDRTSACTANTGSQTLVASYELPAAGLLQVSGLEIVIDIGTASVALPAWWQFKNAGACRLSSLTVNAVNGTTSCSDWVPGGGSGGLAAYSVGLYGPNTARMVIGFATPPPLPDLAGGTEYFACNAKIDMLKTTGTGSCAGCNIAACIICNSIKVATPPVAGQPSRDITLSAPANPLDSDYVRWQGGIGISVGGKDGCPQAVPTHKATWDQVKTLYR